jgi:hypothetical protein
LTDALAIEKRSVMALIIEVVQTEDIPALLAVLERNWLLQRGCVTTWQQSWSSERMEE